LVRPICLERGADLYVAQLMSHSLWCREHSVVMETELQLQDLACGTLFQSSCVIPTSPYTTTAAEGTSFAAPSKNTYHMFVYVT